MAVTKKTYEPISVQLDNGQTVQVKRCTLSDLDELCKLQDKLLDFYIDCNGEIGKILANPEVVSILKSMCSLLPLVEKVNGETVFLDYDSIKDYWEQTYVLFFNSGLDKNTREIKEINKSLVSNLHFLPYDEMIQKYTREKRKQAELEAEKSLQS